MKLTKVTANNHKHAFEVRTRRQDFSFPYAKTELVPTTSDPIVEVYVDPELGNEGFTYRLESGKEGSVHIDEVLEYNEDPPYMADLALYKLTVEARKKFEMSGLSAREVARLLGTSPSQLYRLLDPTSSKNLKQLLLLLYVLGWEMKVELQELNHRPIPHSEGTSRKRAARIAR